MLRSGVVMVRVRPLCVRIVTRNAIWYCSRTICDEETERSVLILSSNTFKDDPVGIESVTASPSVPLLAETDWPGVRSSNDTISATGSADGLGVARSVKTGLASRIELRTTL